MYTSSLVHYEQTVRWWRPCLVLVLVPLAVVIPPLVRLVVHLALHLAVHALHLLHLSPQVRVVHVHLQAQARGQGRNTRPCSAQRKRFLLLGRCIGGLSRGCLSRVQGVFVKCTGY